MAKVKYECWRATVPKEDLKTLWLLLLLVSWSAQQPNEDQHSASPNRKLDLCWPNLSVYSFMSDNEKYLFLFYKLKLNNKKIFLYKYFEY